MLPFAPLKNALNSTGKIMTTDQAPEHSRLSPSKAYQWTVCTASIPFAEKNKDRLPPDKSSAVADEGTKAHTVAEVLALTRLMEPKAFVPGIPDFATKDMISYGRQYADLCVETAGPVPDLYEWGLEKRVPLFYLKQERGTVDFWCWNKKGIHLLDYKYGYDPVSSTKNKQMASYAKSLIDEIDADAWMHGRKIGGDTIVTMIIFQPRINQPLEVWTTTVAELEKFAYVEIEIYAKGILKGEKGVFAPGDKTCKYCRAAAICPARGDWLLSDMDEVAGVPAKKLPAIKTISDERILEIYHHADDIGEWLADIRKYVQGKVLAGMKMDGLKVVLSQGAHRKWVDEAGAGKLMLANGIPYDEVYETSMVTPAQAEKLVKTKSGKWLIELYKKWFKPRGVPIVVAESDPRREHKEDFTQEFLSLPEDGEKSIWD